MEFETKLHNLEKYLESFEDNYFKLLEQVFLLGNYIHHIHLEELFSHNIQNIEKIKESLLNKYTFDIPENIFVKNIHIKHYSSYLVSYYSQKLHFQNIDEISSYIESLFDVNWWKKIDEKYERFEKVIDIIFSKYEDNKEFERLMEILEKIKEEVMEEVSEKSISEKDLLVIFTLICFENDFIENEKITSLFDMYKDSIMGFSKINKFQDKFLKLNQLVGDINP